MVRGIRRGRDLGGRPLPVKLRMDNIPAIDRKGKRLPKPRLIKELRLPTRFGPAWLDPAIQIRKHREDRLSAGFPMVDFVAAPGGFALQHDMIVVANMARLHRDFTIGRGDPDRLVGANRQDDSIEVRELISLSIDRPVIGVAHEDERARHCRRLEHPRPEARVLDI